jgi:hypothetical protein
VLKYEETPGEKRLKMAKDMRKEYVDDGAEKQVAGRTSRDDAHVAEARLCREHGCCTLAARSGGACTHVCGPHAQQAGVAV